MNKITGFFVDSTGKKSTMRLLSFMIVTVGLCMIMLPLVGNMILGEETHTVDWAGASAIVTLGLSSKLVQKSQEKVEVKIDSASVSS